MVFNVCGIVRYKGKKIAYGGVDNRFETDSERVICILKQKGFQEIAVVVPEVEPIPRKLGRPYKHQSKEST